MKAVLFAVVTLLAAVAECYLYGDVNTDVKYSLHTRRVSNRRLFRGYGLKLNTDYDPSLMTYIIIHGWNGDEFTDSDFALDITKALLKHEDCNVIYVDWTRFAVTANYFDAKKKCSSVGKDLAGFITDLETAFNATRTRMHLIGHSLGGQVAGFTGARLQKPKISRITGLDTSGIAFNCLFNKNDCLDPSDADFVDEIHTLISYLPRGHADFWPIPKDTSKFLKDTKVIGAHSVGADYFVKSLEAGPCAFKATKCSSYDSYKKGECKSNEVNNVGFYAKKPTSPPPNLYYISIDLDKPCQ